MSEVKQKSHGVDLDGTLAYYKDWESFQPGVVGGPIAEMVERVLAWVEAGDRVDIFTARVHPSHGPESVEIETRVVKEWCVKCLGFEPIVTCMKDPMWHDYWDDKAVRVVQNGGTVCDGSTVDDPLETEIPVDGIGEFLS